MKNMYNNPSKRSGGSFLFKGLGFLFAVILTVGMLDKAGLNISLKEGDEVNRNTFAQASMGGELPYAKEEEGLNKKRVVIVADEPAIRPTNHYATPQSYAISSNVSSEKKGLNRNIKVEDWIENFSDVAVEQAMSRGIPAGVALAVGVAKIRDGININDWNSFMEEVIEPLAAAKFQASKNDIKSYFKYSANSEKWAEGLGSTGDFSSQTLKSLMKEYALRDFDHEVRNKLSNDPEVEQKAREVAEEVTFAIKESRWERRKATTTESKKNVADKTEQWESEYDEMVGREVAKEIAKKKLKTNKYISEEDMARLVEETNVETSGVLNQKLAFPGRKVNENSPKAESLKDITNPKNTQAREELYQQKLKERKTARKKERS